MKTIKKFCMIISITISLFLLHACFPAIVKVSPNSFFDKMIIQGDQVYMVCYIEFVNISDVRKRIAVSGISDNDVENGLLKERSLSFYILNTDKLESIDEDSIIQLLQPMSYIDIDAHSTKNVICCFVGSHGSETRKHDRNLPTILIQSLPDT